MSDRLSELLATGRPVLADGATHTHIRRAAERHGIPLPPVFELLNIEHPKLVREHYRGYLEVGTDVLLTHSWAANRYALADAHQAPVPAGQVVEINRAAAHLLREEIAQVRPGAVAAGSVGPTGWIVADRDQDGPLHDDVEISYHDAVAAFEEQISALIAGGVDVIWLETHISPTEVRAAIDGWRRALAGAGRPVPYIVSMVFNRSEQTQAQYDLHNFAAEFGRGPDGPAAFGINCGYGPQVTLEQLARNPECWVDRAPLVVKANAGPPLPNGPVYSPQAMTPSQLGRYAQLAVDYGARIIGACCGSTPEHIAGIRDALASYQPKPPRPASLISDELAHADRR